jgi:hypothetical protein
MLTFYWIVLSALLFFVLGIVIFTLALASNVFTTIFLTHVPWVPTPSRIGRRMLSLAELKPGETVFDPGCGDASLLLLAVREFKAGRGIGFELDPAIRLWGKIRARMAGLADKVDLRRGNFLKKELPPADIIVVYLFPEINLKLEPLLKKYYPSGTRVVSHTFQFPGLDLIKTDQMDGEKIYLYRIP